MKCCFSSCDRLYNYINLIDFENVFSLINIDEEFECKNTPKVTKNHWGVLKEFVDNLL